VKTLAILSQKGGAGKTTVAVHLAVMAQAAGERVLLIDIDPQRSTAGWWHSRQADTPELVEADAGDLVRVLAAAKADGVTLAIVDTAPHSERATATAATAADLTLIPCRPGILDLRAVGSTADIVKAARAKAAILLNAAPPGRDGESAITREARAALAAYGLPIVAGSISQRAALAHALNDGRAVTEFDPSGRAADEIKSLWKWVRAELWQRKERR
jgi:chromosome partitioning protein